VVAHQVRLPIPHDKKTGNFRTARRMMRGGCPCVSRDGLGLKAVGAVRRIRTGGGDTEAGGRILRPTGPPHLICTLDTNRPSKGIIN